MTRVVAGVDGGGTSTRAVLVREDGVELARAEVSGAVATAEDPGPVADAVAAAVRSAAERAGVTLPVDVLWAGLAGAGREDAQAAVRAALAKRGLAHYVGVGTDVEAAFMDAFGDSPGLLLVAGTGSIAWGKGPEGGLVRVGGWGESLGDEGSGVWIGREALRAVARAHDGRADATALTQAVLDHLGLDDPTGLIGWAEAAPKRDVASLVPLVVRAAEDGDGAAASILDRALDALEAHVMALLARAEQDPAPGLALWGGLIFEGGPLHERLVRRLREASIDLVTRPIDPSMGAARAALAHLTE